MAINMDWYHETYEAWMGAVVLVSLIVLFNLYEYIRLASAKTTSFRCLRQPILHLTTGWMLVGILPFLFAYYLIAKLILWIRYGRKFGGMLTGADVIFSLRQECICHVICIVQYDTKTNRQTFYEVTKRVMQEVFLTKFKAEPKSFATVEKGLGYYFLLKGELMFESCFRNLKVVNSPTGEITKADLIMLMNEYVDSPLPMNNKAHWEMLVGTQPIKWPDGSKADSIKCYPVVMKGRHSMGDAMHFFKVLLALFADSSSVLSPSGLPACYNIKKRNKIVTYCLKIFLTIMHYIYLPYIISVWPSTMFLNMILMTKKANLIHGPPLINQKIIYFTAEESPHYIEAIKRIKRGLSGCSFEDVLIAAFTASFSEYFTQHTSSYIPDYLVIETPVVPEAVGLAFLTTQEVKKQKIKCRNMMSVQFRKMPISVARGGSKRDLLATLKFVKRERSRLMSRAEREVNSWFMNFVTTAVPVPIAQMSFDNLPSPEVTISNIPGPANFSISGGNLMKDVVPFAGHRTKTGVSIAIFSYNNRMKLSIVVDKALIQEEREAQSILNGFFKYIDLLDSEV